MSEQTWKRQPDGRYRHRSGEAWIWRLPSRWWAVSLLGVAEIYGLEVTLGQAKRRAEAAMSGGAA